jgi:hypothetical protein
MKIVVAMSQKTLFSSGLHSRRAVRSTWSFRSLISPDFQADFAAEHAAVPTGRPGCESDR